MPKHVRLSSYHNIVPNHSDNHKQIDLRNFRSVSTDPDDEKMKFVYLVEAFGLVK